MTSRASHRAPREGSDSSLGVSLAARDEHIVICGLAAFRMCEQEALGWMLSGGEEEERRANDGAFYLRPAPKSQARPPRPNQSVGCGPPIVNRTPSHTLPLLASLQLCRVTRDQNTDLREPLRIVSASILMQATRYIRCPSFASSDLLTEHELQGNCLLPALAAIYFLQQVCVCLNRRANYTAVRLQPISAC